MADTEVPPRRIDKGVKRGKRPIGRPFHTQDLSPRRKNGQIAETLSNDPEMIRQAMVEYSRGATLESLAEKHHVSRQAIYSWLLGGLADDQHNGLVTQALTARIAKADEVLETSALPVDVMRGERMGRFARMDYERRRPHLYGQKQFIDQTVTVTVEASLTEDAKLLLTRIRGAVQQPSQVIDVTPQPIDKPDDAS